MTLILSVHSMGIISMHRGSPVDALKRDGQLYVLL